MCFIVLDIHQVLIYFILKLAAQTQRNFTDFFCDEFCKKYIYTWNHRSTNVTHFE